MRRLTLLLCLLTFPALAFPQNQSDPAPPKDPLSSFTRGVYAPVTMILLRSAEKMPEENYSFKPADTVRSFGQIVGHLADAQYTFCSIVLGEKNPAPNIEKNKSTKAELISALKDSFAYCGNAYEGMTDESATQMVKLFGGDKPKLGVLTVNNMHNMEHYGNIVTYMRMKNLVPPSSEPGFMPAPKP